MAKPKPIIQQAPLHLVFPRSFKATSPRLCRGTHGDTNLPQLASAQAQPSPTATEAGATRGFKGQGHDAVLSISCSKMG